MAFSYTVDSRTSGVLAYSEQINHNLVLKSGTATGGNAATGTIVTGLNYVVAYAVMMTEGVASEQPSVARNVTGAGAAENGSIGVLAQADQVNNIYEWFAIGY